MLERSYKTVLPFAKELEEKGLVLSAYSSSLVSELCSLSAPPQFEKQSPALTSMTAERVEENIQAYGFSLGVLSTGMQESLWGGSFDNSVEILSKKLMGHISFIRNVVCPRIKEFQANSDQHIQEMGMVNPASELEVYKGVIPEFVEEPFFMSMIDAYKLKSPVTPTRYSMNLPFDKAPENFLELLSTGNARLDSMVADWLASTDSRYPETVWKSFFASSDLANQSTAQYIYQEDLRGNNPYVRLNYILIYFLMANYYYNNGPDAVLQESSNLTSANLFEHKSYAGQLICETLRSIELNDKADILVSIIDTDHKQIVVSGKIYDRWLQSGGSVETILGILVSERRLMSVRDINDNSEMLQKAWKNYTTVYVESIEYRKTNDLRKFYLSMMGIFLTPDYREEVEQSYLNQNPNFHSKIIEEAQKWLNKASKEQLLDTWLISKFLIAGFKYQFTYALKFIEDMGEVEKEDKNANPDEASMIAAIKYIVDYLLGQINVRMV